MSSPNVVSCGQSPAKWFLTIDDRRIPAPRRAISEAIIRAQAPVPPDRVIVRDHNSPNDPVLADGAEVDLGQGNVFYTIGRCDARQPASCGGQPKLAFSVDDRVEEVLIPSQTANSLLDLFGIDHSKVLFRDYESPNDVPINAEEPVQYEAGPVFYTRAAPVCEVAITIDGKSYNVLPGDYSVGRIKEIGGVPAAFELSQVINRVLTPLPDSGTVCIKGGEVFVSHPRSGGSS